MSILNRIKEIENKNHEDWLKIIKENKKYDQNISTLFLLPLLSKRRDRKVRNLNDLEIEHSLLFIKYDFIQSFIYLNQTTEDKKTSKESLEFLYLVFKEGEVSEKFENDFKDLIDIKEQFYETIKEWGDCVIYKCKFPKDVTKKDIKLILEGKYSEISDQNKGMFFPFHFSPLYKNVHEKGITTFSYIVKSLAYYVVNKDIEQMTEILNEKYEGLNVTEADLEGIELYDCSIKERETLDL